MSKKKGKKKMEEEINVDEVEQIEEIEPEEINNKFEFEPLPEVKSYEPQVIKVSKPVKFVMPDTSEIFIIKDQGDSKLVIKKDGTKIIIPK